MINDFRGQYRYLSNYHFCKINYEGITYPSTEHAFQAAKTLDKESRLIISKLEKPAEAKRAGQIVQLRPNWNSIRIGIMYDICKIKFTQPDLKAMLLSTGDETLVEGNWWKDTFWGVCNGTGENNLGKILMKIREELRND